ASSVRQVPEGTEMKLVGSILNGELWLSTRSRGS
ncbi:MAG: hypothetical protein ACI9MC_003323, partial [Kiritimatiellia bacterium]